MNSEESLSQHQGACDGMDLHAQLIVVGVSIGCVYALIALGFLIIYNGLSALNFAQGDFVMVGALLAVWFTTDLALPHFAAFVAVCALMAMFGYVFGKVVFEPAREGHFTVFLIATVGASIFLSNAAQLIWGPFPLSMPSFLGSDALRVGPINVPMDYVVVVSVSALALLLLYLFFMYTFTGRLLRAVATDRETAALVGINVEAMSSVVFVLSALLSGVAGFLVAPIFFAIATMGPPLAIKGFVAVVIGGFGNLPGAVVGGLMVGLLESYVGYFLSSEFKDTIIFGLLILMLLFLPQGLFGERIEEKP